ncbi:MAG: hypothetical protein SH847_21945 [Roseiflexaceae bacterium]|nr:hypothetical protein [Roseiflexaceae bacterium]
MSTHQSVWLSDHAPRRLLIVGLVVLIGLIVSCIIVVPSLRLSTGLLLAPPTYRNSKLVSERMGGGTGGMRRTVISETPDPIAQVVAALNSQLPGFQQTTVYRNNKPLANAYRNYQCNDTPLTIWFRRYFTAIRANYCVSVILYTDPVTNSGTILEMEVAPVQ